MSLCAVLMNFTFFYSFTQWCSSMTMQMCPKHRKTWCVKSKVKDFWCPDINAIEHHWDELERWVHCRPHHSTSVPNLTKSLIAEWSQISSKSLPRKNGGQKSFGHMCIYQVSTILFTNGPLCVHKPHLSLLKSKDRLIIQVVSDVFLA